MGNLILDVDSYKSSHYLGYPPGTANLHNYLESRGGVYPKTVFFGLQYLLQEYLSQPVTAAQVEEAYVFFGKHGLPFNLEGWNELLVDHGGYLPLQIKALPEGTVTPTGIPLLTCEATDPKYFWLVGWFETMLMRIWYPTTVATVSWHLKQVIKKYLEETADDLSGLPFKLHDFGSRGVSSRESAAIGGAAHLVNFMGSDTVVGVDLANRYYDHEMAAFSIPAAEHSTITSWGRDREVDAYRNMIRQFSRPGSIYAVVSDSYDIENAVENIWGETLRQEVIDGGGRLVVRPDSGDPVFMVNTILHALDRKFGSTTNSKGYKLLRNVRVIQGDGLNPATIEAILKSTKLAGFSTDNVAFGMGGGLLQSVNRDTQQFAYKCSAIAVADPLELAAFNAAPADGNQKLVADVRDVYKDPASDPGKKSKRGPQGAKRVDGQWVACSGNDPDNALRMVFKDGVILVRQTLDEIRKRSEEG